MSEHKAVAKQDDPIYDLLKRYMPAIRSVLPTHLKPERMLRIAHTMIYRVTKLKECTPVSLINAVIDISMKGLEIGTTAYIIPFKTEATVIYDYKGLIELAYRSGMINSFPFKPVYANDFFEYEEGTQRFIKHRPAHIDRGHLIAAYAIVNFKHGGYDFEVVHPDDISAVKKVAPGAKKADSPWNKPDQEWTMWCKTAVRRLAKRIPQSPELQSAVTMEEKIESGLKQDIGHITEDAIEAEFKTIEQKKPVKNDNENLQKKLDALKSGNGPTIKPEQFEEITETPPEPEWYDPINWVNKKRSGFEKFLVDNDFRGHLIPINKEMEYKGKRVNVRHGIFSKAGDLNIEFPDNWFQPPAPSEVEKPIEVPPDSPVSDRTIIEDYYGDVYEAFCLTPKVNMTDNLGQLSDSALTVLLNMLRQEYPDREPT